MKAEGQLYNHVMEKLEYEPSINSSNITMVIHDNIVTLGGFVGSFPEKRAAERAVNSIRGVKAVANEIKVDLSEMFKRSDVDIAEATLKALEWDTYTPHERINVAVEDGRVTLTGDVDSWYQRKSAEKAIRNLIGIKDINNHIAIKPAISPTDVKNKILKEFEHNAALHALNIQIETRSNEVSLRGIVKSWEERKEAERAAWSIPGVTNVVNLLTIGY